MLLNEICPFVRTSVIGSLGSKTPNDVFFELITADCRLYYIVSGEGDIIIEGKRHLLSAGNVILFSSGTKYTWCPKPSRSLDYIAVNFDYTMTNSHIKKSFHPVHSDKFSSEQILENIRFEDATVLNTPIFLESSTLQESQFRHIVTEYLLGGEFTEQLLSSVLKSIIISIVREICARKGNSSDTGLSLAKSIMRYIQKNYFRLLSYDTLARDFNMSPIYLNRIFKRFCGSSIHSFIISYRVNAAMDLLRSSNFPVKDIALAVGFTDLPHFIKSFKRHTGQTPSNYRNSI